MTFGLAACAQQQEPVEKSAPRVTFSGPDYITIKHDPVASWFAPTEVMLMAERYCAASNKSAVVTHYGRYETSTSFVCVEPGERPK